MHATGPGVAHELRIQASVHCFAYGRVKTEVSGRPLPIEQ